MKGPLPQLLAAPVCLRRTINNSNKSNSTKEQEQEQEQTILGIALLLQVLSSGIPFLPV